MPGRIVTYVHRPKRSPKRKKVAFWRRTVSSIALTLARGSLSLSRMEALIERGDRFFVALRKDGRAGNGSPVYHAVTPDTRPALCGTEPSARSRWAEPPAIAVTCPTCLQRLQRLDGHIRLGDGRETGPVRRIVLREA
jgi:hypothetical protein